MCPMGITYIQKSLGVLLRHAQAVFRAAVKFISVPSAAL